MADTGPRRRAPADGEVLMIVGLPRSGTTWLGKIFDSHPETFYSHEPDTRRFRDVPLLIPPESTESSRGALVREVEALRAIHSLRVVGKLPLFPKRYIRSSSVRTRTFAVMALKSASRLLGNGSVPRFIAGAPDEASLWVWKSIESSGRLGALARTFPHAKSVFIVRHPCGVAASLLRGEAGARFSAGPASDDFGFFQLLAETEPARRRGLTLSAFRDMSTIQRTAWRWALLNEKAMNDVRELDRCRVLRYEDLCANPAAVAKDLFQFVGLSWDGQTERFLQASTTHRQSDYYSVFKDSLDSAYRWKKDLPGEVIEEVMNTVGDTAPGRLYAESDFR